MNVRVIRAGGAGEAGGIDPGKVRVAGAFILLLPGRVLSGYEAIWHVLHVLQSFFTITNICTATISNIDMRLCT